MVSFVSLALVSALLGAGSSYAISDSEGVPDDCAAYGSGPHGSHVVVEPRVKVYPVKVNQYFESNTVININEGASISINNAPVYIDTIITATTTSFVTSTV